MGKQAWAVNAIIIADNGSSVDWKPRCPYCGEVPWNICFRGQHAPDGGRAMTYTICTKCGQRVDVTFGRG